MVVGLGNPGHRYEKTRHNAGFLFIDAIATHYQIKLIHKPFSSVTLGEGRVMDSTLHLIKPETFMNNSGRVLPKLMQKNGIELQNLLVIVDNMDLPLGALRLKKGGSSAGHNGLKSIFSFVGNDFYRLYVGVGKPDTTQKDVISHVLSPFNSQEFKILELLMNSIYTPIEYILKGEPHKAINEINSLRISQ